MASQVDGADVMLGDLVEAVATSKLHGDLMIEIFARLPVKSILRFKSVRRAWYALFNSPAFIRHHCDINRSSAEKIYKLSLLLHVHRSGLKSRKDDEIFSLFLEHSGGNPIAENLKIPFEGTFSYNFLVVGSINGLVCLNVAKNFTSFMLWNPAIKKHCHIRKPQLVVGESDYVSAGFAYDQKTDSYKVIRISYVDKLDRKGSTLAKVEIYSTGTDTWSTKEIVGFPFLSELHKYLGGVVISGDPYWFSPLAETFEKLIWFDSSTEDFRICDVPHDDSDCHWDCVSLKGMGQDLALMDRKYYLSSGSDSEQEQEQEQERISRVDIRKLIKYNNGGEDLLHMEKMTVELGGDLADIVGFGRHGEIIAHDRDYKTLLLLCDEEENKHLARYGEGFSYVYCYNESLVWPSSLA